ncbi:MULTISPECIES: helix-turn-helix domain-containing protein [Bacteroidota]|jgi:transcriptional regulator with XRE-family HTH domain|uniref:Helix-turn-helix transcriptional regulator n=1 Tax=Flectobacillus rivi TaxID=2984209 RepID=A0ABT6Z879_9BACT|nr:MULTISPECIES: helix-turn-helix transcriptional regulator [Bacteroidota]MDI9876821.1 helix-turn-helix transcriptional regulator [Flectobacillus rivi]MDI9881637.1 helix-turn-helix transcriptional regulator [Flectobacillus longus]NBB30189.1 helix-turn-helix domain-containing protein [Cellulophaga sp. BC115SP]
MQFRGSIVKKVRKEKGFKQSHLAELLGMSQSYLSKIENDRVSMSVTDLGRISTVLECEVGRFFIAKKRP